MLVVFEMLPIADCSQVSSRCERAALPYRERIELLWNGGDTVLRRPCGERLNRRVRSASLIRQA